MIMLWRMLAQPGASLWKRNNYNTENSKMGWDQHILSPKRAYELRGSSFSLIAYVQRHDKRSVLHFLAGGFVNQRRAPTLDRRSRSELLAELNSSL